MPPATHSQDSFLWRYWVAVQGKLNLRVSGGRRAGFTLVEIIVALGLFTVVMMVSVGSLVSLSDVHRKVQSMRIAFDNLNLALESMSREIRTGVLYHCDATITPIQSERECQSGESSFTFLSQDGNQFIYRLNGSTIQRSIDGGASWADITAPEINVDYLDFYVFGADGSDPITSPYQPHVLISVGGTAGTRVTSEFKIQTTVTQRTPK